MARRSSGALIAAELVTPAGEVIGHVLGTRGHVGQDPVVALGPLGRWDEIKHLLEAERFPLDVVIQQMYLARCAAKLGADLLVDALSGLGAEATPDELGAMHGFYCATQQDKGNRPALTRGSSCSSRWCRKAISRRPSRNSWPGFSAGSG